MADAAMADVVIAGGGPAGATLALLLGRAGPGRRALRGASSFPREKPCGEGIMPAGVAVLERLGLRDAVGGRPLATVRYHGFGLTAEAAFRRRADGRRRSRSAQRRWLLDQTLLAAARATPGVRVFEEAPVEGAVVEGGRAVGLRVGGELRRGRPGRRRRRPRLAGAALARAGTPRAAATGRVGVRMHFRLAAGRAEPSRLEIFVGRGYELYAAPLPDGELLLAGARRSRRARRRARATRWSAGSPSSRCCATGWTARRR